MKQFADKFLSTTLQPQVFSLVLVTLILVVLAIIIYAKVKKQPVNKAPQGFLFVTEKYVSSFQKFYDDTTNSAFPHPAPYIFTLFTFLLFGNMFNLIGLDQPATSYSVTLSLALVSWIGIYVVGIIHKRFSYFKKFLNPIDFIGQFAPLISLSFRIFGNLVGGSVILYLIYDVTGFAWSFIPVVGEFNLLGAVIAPSFHAYFDLLGGVIQALVFSMLTTMFWAMEAESAHEPARQEKVELSLNTKRNIILLKGE